MPNIDLSPRAKILSLFNQRKVLTFLLLILVLVSTLMESLGFAMILPLMDGIIGIESESFLADFFKNSFAYFNIDMNLINVSIVFALLIVLKSVFIVAREGFRSYFTYSFKKEATLKINQSLLFMDFDDFLSSRQGYYISDITKQLELASLLLLQFIELVTSTVFIIALLTVMFLAEPVATLVLLGAGAIIFGGFKVMLYRYSKGVGVREVQLNHAIIDSITESVVLMREFRLNMLERFQLNRVNVAFSKLLRLLVRWDAITSAITPLIEMIVIVSFVSYIVFQSVNGNTDSLVTFFPTMAVILVLAHRLLQRVSILSRNIISLNKYMASFLAIYEYYRKDYVKNPSLDEGKAVDFNQDIVLSNVNVISSENAYVLDDVSFPIYSGKVTAIIGETGSGKSTVVDLIVGLRRAVSGSITIGDTDLNSIGLHTIRSNISVVSQSTSLRNDTVLNNILSGNLNSSVEEVYEVTKALGLHEFILTLPEGYETNVGDRGGLLSGGQVQRIAIARALLRKPQVLILDEATSALDFKTEEMLNNKILELMSGKTVLVITHRPSILQYCDNVYFIEHGKIKLQK